MSFFKQLKLYLIRNPFKNIILCFIMSLIILGELIGVSTHSMAINGKEDAFLRSGASYSITSKDGKLTSDIYKKILNIKHVDGTYNWKETVAQPLSLTNVKDYSGEDPTKSKVEEESYKLNSVVILSQTNTKLYSWFRWENAVNLISGVYPTTENKGVLIESRFAEINHLKLGSDISFSTEEAGTVVTFPVCGIYNVDSDFVITKNNKVGEGVFIYSPHNVIFADYSYTSNIIGYENTSNISCELYVDSMDNVKYVGTELRKILGSEFEILDNSSYVSEGERGIVNVLNNYSLLLMLYVFLVGSIILLLVLSIFANQFKKESGLLLSIGYSKKRIITQYFVSMICILISSFLPAFIIYFASGETLVSHLNTTAQAVVGSSLVYDGTGPYIITNLNQPFRLTTNINSVFEKGNIAFILLSAISILLISVIIPLYHVLKTKPKFLLAEY